MITLRILFCCSVSREMLSGKSSESTTPLTNVSQSGIRSSQLSMMKTRRTYSLMCPEFFFFGSKRSNGRALRHEEDRGELELALDGEVLDSEVLLPVVGERLVEGAVLLLGHLLGLARPDRLLLVHQVPLVRHLLDLLLLLLLLLRLLVDLLDLGLVAVLLLLLVLRLVLVVVHLLVHRLLGPERDRVVDELGVLLDQVLEAALLEVLELVLLEVAHDLGAAPERLAVRVLAHGEGAARRRLPDVLLVVVVLRRHD